MVGLATTAGALALLAMTLAPADAGAVGDRAPAAHQAHPGPRVGPKRTHSHRRRRARAAIFGGQTAAPGTFPYLAFVIDENTEGFGLCSGTVVAPNLVLTAGHCLENTETGVVNAPAGYTVVSGNVDWAASPRQVSAVSRVIVDPLFQPSLDVGDAGLLQLVTPTTEPAISLATAPSDSGALAPGAPATVAGWGKTSPEEEGLPEQLQWAETYVQAAKYCEESAPTFFPSLEACAIKTSAPTDGACTGDSGGPLLSSNSTGTVELGLVAHGYGSCAVTRPTVFTRADSIAAWVDGWIGALKSARAGPAAPAVPTPAAVPQPPLAPFPTVAVPNTPGYYVTRPSRTRKIVIHVSGDGENIVGLHIEMPVPCRRGHPMALDVSYLSYRRYLAITKHAVRETLHVSADGGSRAGTIALLAGFNRPGSVEGRLRVRIAFKRRHAEVCAGTLKFKAEA